jgi:hypothetical protein
MSTSKQRSLEKIRKSNIDKLFNIIPYDMKTELIKRFREGNLTSEDLKQNYTKVMTGKPGQDPWGNDCYFIDDMRIYFSGEVDNYMDRGSVHIIRHLYKIHTIKIEVLFTNYNSEIGKPIGLNSGGFYSYNPDRRKPDSIVALKLVEVIEPKPKSKGYTVIG